ncbi:MAG: cytidine deaminase [bacterium]|nr:cytidine deaminase [bacterium]
MKQELIKLIKNTKSMYYNFPVVAILECYDGKTFNGVNIETSSPAAGICAERCAIYSAIANGYDKKDFKTLHIGAASCEIVYPCMICRQTLLDLCPENLDIALYDLDSEKIEHTTIKELTPNSFSKEDL